MHLKRAFMRIRPIEPSPKYVTPKFDSDTAYQRALWAMRTEHETSFIPASKPINRRIKCRHTTT